MRKLFYSSIFTGLIACMSFSKDDKTTHIKLPQYTKDYVESVNNEWISDTIEYNNRKLVVSLPEVSFLRKQMSYYGEGVLVDFPLAFGIVTIHSGSMMDIPFYKKELGNFNTEGKEWISHSGIIDGKYYREDYYPKARFTVFSESFHSNPTNIKGCIDSIMNSVTIIE